MQLAVLSPYTDPVRGGITSYTRELVSAYRELGINTLGLAQAGETNSRFEVVAGTRIEFCLKSTLRILRWKAEVVHGHSHWPELLPGLALKLLRPKTRVLFTFHTPPFDPAGRIRMSRRMRRALFLALVRLCDGVSFVSRETEAEVALPPSVRQAVVHAAPEHFTGPAHAIVGEPGKQPVILAVSVLTWPKKVEGLLLLLDAFAAVAASFPDWRLVVVGDGPLRGRVQERVANLNLEGRVVLKGFVDNVRDEMATASVFTQISLQEGLPIALLDAMASGLPVVATAVGGMPEVVQNRITGYVVGPSKEAISGALRELLGDPNLRRRIGESARLWVARELTWEKVAIKNLEMVGKTPL